MSADQPGGARLGSTPGPHLAAVADHALLTQLTMAARWWAAQRTWHVSSSHTGGGVIAAFEAAVAAEVAGDGLALALPSGTAALSTALSVLGVGAGDRVGVPGADWSASAAVLRSLGAVPVPLPVDPLSGLIDAAECGAPPGLAAVIAVHLHGLTADVPAIRRRWRGVPVVEDAARAWGARYPGGAPVGSAADACAFSFGAGKTPSAGELGCLVTRDAGTYREAVRRTQHPTRQMLAGVPEPCQDQVMTRPAPTVALLGAYTLREFAQLVPALRQAATEAAAAMRGAGLRVLTDPAIHAPGTVAVHAPADQVRSALAAAGLAAVAIDPADVIIHPDYPPRLAAAVKVRELTVITRDPGAICSCPRAPNGT